MKKSWSTNRSMYHEGNPGARILEHEFLMKEFLGRKLLTSMFLMFFFQKKPGARCI